MHASQENVQKKELRRKIKAENPFPHATGENPSCQLSHGMPNLIFDSYT